MYKIIGADQKEYGPISADQIRQWISEGRVNGQTRVCAEGSLDWKPLEQIPEFGFTASSPAGGMPGVPASAPISLEEISAGDYNLDIGGVISRGWSLFSANFGLLIGACLIYFGIEIFISLIGSIPLIGALFSLGNLVIVGPLMGGLYYVFLQAIRHQPATAGDIFMGFKKSFLHLFLGYLVPLLIGGLFFIPVALVAVATLGPSMGRHEPPPAGPVLITLAVFLVCMIPFMYLTINWIFTLALIIDRGMEFWPAMQLSSRMVRKHWWQVFGVVVLIGLINIGGTLLCCIGVIFTMPITFGALMYTYEDIFSRKTA